MQQFKQAATRIIDPAPVAYITICARVPRDFTEAERAAYNIADQAPTCPNR